MATLRERIAAWRGADELNDRMGRLETSLTLALNAVADPQFTTAEELIGQLREYDPDYVDLLVDQLGWEYIGGVAPSADRERQAAVEGSRLAWSTSSPLGQWGIWTWTAWGLGDSIAISAEDEGAQEWWDEFIEADRNAAILGQDNIHGASERVLVNGNMFLAVYASTVDGRCTARAIPQDEMVILTNPDDSMVPWFYKRTFSTGSSSREMYYPDWALAFGGEDAPITVDEAWARLIEQRQVPAAGVRADMERRNGELRTEAGTDVCVLHIGHNRKDFDSLWGWPILTVALPWLRSHKRYAQARLAVALAVAQFVRRSKVEGGSRQVASVVDYIKSNLSRTQYTDTNPPAAPGAWHVENSAVDTKELPMTTGASDAKPDNDIFAWLAGIGMGMNTTTLGLDTARYATAVQMDKVQSFLFTRYKSFWSQQFKRLARIVFSFGERYGGQSFSSMKVQVSIDSFSLPDFPDIVNAESQFMAQLTSAVNASMVPKPAAAAIFARMAETALQALGVSDAADLTSDEAFEIGDFEPEEPEPPPIPPMIPGQMPGLPVEQPEVEEPEEEIPPMESMHESHEGTQFNHTCPLCGHNWATYYEGHGGLVVCEGCHKTYDPSIE